MVTYLPRSAWKARAARGSTALVASAVEGEALHWPGMAKPINATGTAGQARIASALRGWQNYHMDTRGWSDIAYMIAIDQAGRAWTLRGLNIRSGANGDGDVNRRFGAFLLILAPGEQPSAAMIATTKGVITDFRKRFPKARLKPYGHQDVRPRNSSGDKTTDCPGPIAEKDIQDGKFTPGTTPAAPPKPPAQETDMPLNDADKKWITGEVQRFSAFGAKHTDQIEATTDDDVDLILKDDFAKLGVGIQLLINGQTEQTAAINRLAAAIEAGAPKV